MTQILVVSLGSSTEPVVNCIASLRPDRVIFLCSDGSRSQVDSVREAVPIPEFEEGRDIVVLQQRFSRRQGEEVISELDHLDLVYTRAADLLKRLRRESPGSTLMVDYTGGTKTMAAGLAMAAIDIDGVQLLVTTTSERPRGENTLSGPSLPVAVAKMDIQACRLLDQELPLLLKRFDYEAARLAVSRVRQLASRTSSQSAQLLRLERLCNAFDAWDRFDHQQAFALIEVIGDPSLAPRLLMPLRRIMACRQLAEGEDFSSIKFIGHGLEAVEDLILNAERRAVQQRWDDAVGRLYRAIELTAQILLLIDVGEQVGPEGIRTADVDIDKLPADLQAKYRQKSRNRGKLQLGLRDAFDLLAQLGHPTGLAWQAGQSRFIDLLSTRNMSLFAHGFMPISFADWNRFKGAFSDLLYQSIEHRRQDKRNVESLLQLPNALEDLQPSTDPK